MPNGSVLLYVNADLSMLFTQVEFLLVNRDHLLVGYPRSLISITLGIMLMAENHHRRW